MPPKACILVPALCELSEKVFNCCCADLIPELKLLASKFKTAVITPRSYSSLLSKIKNNPRISKVILMKVEYSLLNYLNFHLKLYKYFYLCKLFLLD